ncbi:MAG: response regulator transcription factor [Taibaiella sp.]|nr:response regulator transcription factor [Taibaiella sp.]MBX9449686.1 response regulator transcription factor [Taibaiella sp.]
MIHLAIVDDHPLILNGIKELLSEYTHIIITGEFPNAKSLLSAFAVSCPDILLLDIQLPDKSGDKLLIELKKKYPGLKVIVLSNFDSALYISNMMSNGADGYLLKTSGKLSIIHAIESVYQGIPYLANDLKKKVSQLEEGVKKNMSSKFMLTKREKEVLQLIVNGHTNNEIAQKLFLSIHTIENYRDNILMKLEVKNTALMVKKAIALSLVD